MVAEKVSWFDIAATLKHEFKQHRTPVQIIEYWQRTYNTQLQSTGKWTKEEDAILHEVVSKCGYFSVASENQKDWVKVALLVQEKGCRRNEQQCLHRWRYINPTVRKGHFSQEEDEALRHAVPKFTIASESSRERASAKGQVNVVNWKAVAGEMPHVRRPEQLQVRWRALCQEVDRIEADAGGGAADEGQSASGSTQMVVRGRRKGVRHWTPEEDGRLMEVVAHHRLQDKNVWQRIAEQMPDRDRKACRDRFAKLQPHLSLQARVERGLREQMVPRARAQLGSRAKKREHNQPLFGLEDFAEEDVEAKKRQVEDSLRAKKKQKTKGGGASGGTGAAAVMTIPRVVVLPAPPPPSDPPPT